MQRNLLYSLLILISLVAGLIFYENFLPDIQARYNQQKLIEEVETMLAGMPLQAKIGQMLLVELPGNTMNQRLEQLLKEVQPGGLIFFPYNLNGLKGTQQFTTNLQLASKIPLFLAIDQEGGLIQKLKEGVPEVNDFPGVMALGATDSPTLSYELAQTMGAELKAVGMNMVFAPVLDVNSNPDNPVIGIRSFGADPKLVASLGVAFMDGLTRAGMIPVGKHFPGHGDTSADSHYGTAQIPYGEKRLAQVELVPFKAVIENQIPALMTAHITIPKVVTSGEPATLSSKILTDLLRQDLGYDGLVITDAMNMKAISSHFGEDESVVQAVQAGADLILMPISPKKAHQALVQAVERGEISEERIDQSVKRILLLKLTKGLFQKDSTEENDPLVWSKGREVAQKVADQAVTLVKNEADLIPLHLEENEKVVVVTPIKSVTQIYVAKLHQIYRADQVQGFTANNLILSAYQWKKVAEADRVIVATNSRVPATRQANHSQMQTVAKINRGKKDQLIWVSLQTPYELMTFPETKTYLAQYGYNQMNSQAMIRMIVGEIEPVGQLPVELNEK